jgi:hypothetical protein
MAGVPADDRSSRSEIGDNGRHTFRRVSGISSARPGIQQERRTSTPPNQVFIKQQSYFGVEHQPWEQITLINFPLLTFRNLVLTTSLVLPKRIRQNHNYRFARRFKQSRFLSTLRLSRSW